MHSETEANTNPTHLDLQRTTLFKYLSIVLRSALRFLALRSVILSRIREILLCYHRSLQRSTKCRWTNNDMLCKLVISSSWNSFISVNLDKYHFWCEIKHINYRRPFPLKIFLNPSESVTSCFNVILADHGGVAHQKSNDKKDLFWFKEQTIALLFAFSQLSNSKQRIHKDKVHREKLTKISCWFFVSQCTFNFTWTAFSLWRTLTFTF